MTNNLPPVIVGEHSIANFTYVGSNISNTRDSEKDVQTRIGEAAGVSTSTKLHLYMSVVIPTVTYTYETWMKPGSITNKLDVFSSTNSASDSS